MTDRKWSKEEVAWLRRVYPKEGVAGFWNKFPNRSRASIWNKAMYLNIRMTTKGMHSLRCLLRRASSDIWTKREIFWLRKCYLKGGSGDFIKKFSGRKSRYSIWRKAYELGLKRDRHTYIAWNRNLNAQLDGRILSGNKHPCFGKPMLPVIKKRISVAKIKFIFDKDELRKLYVSGKSLSEIASVYDCSAQCVHNNMKRFGLECRNYKQSTLRGQRHYFYGQHHTKETLKKMILYARNRSESHLRKLSDARLKLLRENPAFLKRILVFDSPNGFESDIVNSLNSDWKYCGDGSVILNGHCPDFINVSGKKQVILANGNYWHTITRGIRTKKQAERIERKPYNELGYDVLFIWEDEWKALKTDEKKHVFIERLL